MTTSSNRCRAIVLVVDRSYRGFIPGAAATRLRNKTAGAPVCSGDMTLTGRLHPLLIHSPIALILFAAAAEPVATATNRREWRLVAIGILRAGAVFVVAAAVSGWLLAASV